MNRRSLITKTALSSFAFLSATNLAQAATICIPTTTATQPEGPFYPVKDQPDTDSDLVSLNGSNKIAKGEIIFIEGVVTDQHCQPVQKALVEVWQACHSGKYNHPSDPNTAPLDPNFQYWGKALTDENGLYKFRTILPGAYPADTGWIRPPHIHFKVAKIGYIELITQMYFEGERYNNSDKILQRLSAEQQKEVVVALQKKNNTDLRTGQFNIKIEKL